MDTMKGGHVVAPGQVECAQGSIRPPEEGELVVKNMFASICGSDLHNIFMGLGFTGANAPLGYPGHEGIGDVIESQHADFSEGERVLTVPSHPFMNSFAEYQTLPARYCIKVTSQAPADHLLMAQQLGTTIFALRHLPVDVVGKTVAIIGQGSAGMFLAYMLKRAGAAKIIASDPSELRLTTGREMGGVDIAVKARGDDMLQAVMDHTGGEGADYVVEAVGKAETQAQAIDLAKIDGNLLYFGLPGTLESIPFDFNKFFRKRLKINTTYGAQDEPGLVSFKAARDMILRREIDVSKLVSQSFPIEKISDALKEAHENPARSLKVGIRF